MTFLPRFITKFVTLRNSSNNRVLRRVSIMNRFTVKLHFFFGIIHFLIFYNESRFESNKNYFSNKIPIIIHFPN